MSEVDRPTQKAEHRGERLLWSGSADAIVERKLRKEAEQECKEQLRALGECIKRERRGDQPRPRRRLKRA